jgi:hypothetical protein
MTDGDYTAEVRRYLDETLPNGHSESVDFLVWGEHRLNYLARGAKALVSGW